MKNGDRNDLFYNIIIIAHAVNSTYVFFENVTGLPTKKIDGKPGGRLNMYLTNLKGVVKKLEYTTN